MSEAAGETATVRITVRHARSVESRVIYALVDVDIDIDGLTISVLNVQARRTPSGGTDIELPRTRREDGIWLAAIVLPQAISEALTAVVLQHLVEEGLAHNRLLHPSQVRGWLR